ncbi:hypothetical protein OH76DRAFT_1489921 [Lentinus brumalis]|uniref:Prolyl 4-hydroxylase alpha subunit domain-containing protein n=1 Tax=Lentinus brumalis TaxID=2498619 RepID=A0A371CKV8_9APHY|nr:hypothetical protein OH76DRAFT_1489921 [Polyporus brumalis]
MVDTRARYRASLGQAVTSNGLPQPDVPGKGHASVNLESAVTFNPATVHAANSSLPSEMLRGEQGHPSENGGTVASTNHAASAGKKRNRTRGRKKKAAAVSAEPQVGQKRPAPAPTTSKSVAKKWKMFVATPEAIKSHIAQLSTTTEVEDMSDLSESERPSRWSNRPEVHRHAAAISGIRRHARTAARLAATVQGTTQGLVFSLTEAVSTPHGPAHAVQPVEPHPTVWSGDIPRRYVTADGYAGVYHIPHGIPPETLRRLVAAASKWGRSVKLSRTLANDKKGGYQDAGELVGSGRIVTAWHPIGHPHDPAGVSADARRTAQGLEATCQLIEDLDGATAYVMELLKAIDPEQYDSLEKLYEWRISKYKAAKAIESSSKVCLFFEGRELQFNRYSKPHWDTQDPHWAWAIIIYFGTFPQCRMKFRQLRLEVVLRPGDVVALRGQDILHEAGNLFQGERHLLVHFTHATLWNEAFKEIQLKIKTGLAVPSM